MIDGLEKVRIFKEFEKSLSYPHQCGNAVHVKKIRRQFSVIWGLENSQSNKNVNVYVIMNVGSVSENVSFSILWIIVFQFSLTFAGNRRSEKLSKLLNKINCCALRTVSHTFFSTFANAPGEQCGKYHSRQRTNNVVPLQCRSTGRNICGDKK